MVRRTLLQIMFHVAVQGAVMQRFDGLNVVVERSAQIPQGFKCT